MTKDEFQVVESILSLFPELCRAADQRRDYVVSLVLAPNHGEPVQGGTGVSAIERFVDGDRESANLKIILDRIVGCLEKLRAEEGRFVERYYFEGQSAYDFEESGSVLYGKRRKVCAKLAGVLGIYHLVREWREVEQMRRLEAAKVVRGAR
mgnify:CR=1 FL=1